MMEIGTNSSGASIRDVKRTIGPSAPPIVAIAAEAWGVSPKTVIPTASVTNVPSSAQTAMAMELHGFASR